MKMYVKPNAVILFLISVLISNIYTVILNNRYDEYYKTPPKKIEGYAVVVRRFNRKRI